jgi:hypothetical protein
VPNLPPLRAGLAVVLAAGLLVFGAGPASAHVEATVSDGAQAGDGPVTVAFAAEAESPSAGIASVKTQLPGGVLPEWVSLASGPPGWVLSPTSDGYEVGGPALPPGADAEFTVGIAELPADSTELPLKTLVRYADGSEDAWIEEPTPDDPEPENPAPVITVAPAAAPTSTTAPSLAPDTSAPATPRTSPAGADDGGRRRARRTDPPRRPRCRPPGRRAGRLAALPRPELTGSAQEPAGR